MVLMPITSPFRLRTGRPVAGVDGGVGLDEVLEGVVVPREESGTSRASALTIPAVTVRQNRRVNRWR